MQYTSIELVHMAKLIYKNTTEIMMLLYSGQFVMSKTLDLYYFNA